MFPELLKLGLGGGDLLSGDLLSLDALLEGADLGVAVGGEPHKLLGGGVEHYFYFIDLRLKFFLLCPF